MKGKHGLFSFSQMSEYQEFYLFTYNSEYFVPFFLIIFCHVSKLVFYAALGLQHSSLQPVLSFDIFSRITWSYEVICLSLFLFKHNTDERDTQIPQLRLSFDSRNPTKRTDKHLDELKMKLSLNYKFTSQTYRHS